MTLAEMTNQARCVISGFEQSNGSTLTRLYALGLVPGAVLTVLRRAPLGDPIQVKVGGALVSIRKVDAAGILVDAGE